MTALVVHESHWGNTRAVAGAIAEGLSDSDGGPVQVVDVGSAPSPLPDGVDLVVLGVRQRPPRRRVRVGDEVAARREGGGDPALADQRLQPRAAECERGWHRSGQRLIKAVAGDAQHDAKLTDRFGHGCRGT